jgi:hypothetical protein
MYLSTLFSLALMACTAHPGATDRARCTPTIRVTGFVTSEACYTAAKAIGTGLHAIDPKLMVGIASCRPATSREA